MNHLDPENNKERKSKTRRNKITLPKEPYRGIKPFRYADRYIFSARDWEQEQLLNLILLYRGSLLYGESGIGKSSLVNAGLVPLMEKNKLQPEIIRIYPSYKEPFRIYRIENSDSDKTYLPSLFDQFSTGNDQERICLTLDEFKQHLLLQTYGKTEEEQLAINEKPIPVLLFDQFEEVITLFEETSKTAVADGDIPFDKRRGFQSELFEFLRDCYYDPNLRVKLMFSFREDYLAKLSKLFRAIPDLRNRSLRIKAIDKNDIKGIIKSPFVKLADKNPYDASFKAIIPDLNEKLLSYFGERSAVLTDVQIVSQYLYDTPADRVMLKSATADNEDIIDTFIQKFYAKQLASFGEEDKTLAIAILSLLVLNEHTRNIYHTDAIVAELMKEGYNAKLINNVLVKLDDGTRLIKSELRGGAAGAYYEINSESLIPYINRLKLERDKEIEEKKFLDLKQEKELKEKILADDLEKAADRERILSKNITAKNRVLVALIAVVIFCIGCIALVVFEYVSNVKNKSDNYFIAAKLASSPSLGYSIAIMRLKEDKGNEKLLTFVHKQDSNILINNVFFNPDEIVAGFFRGSDTLGIIGKSNVNYFNKTGLLVKQHFFTKIVYADVKHGYLINNVSNSLVSLNNSRVDTNEVCTFDGKVITKFTAGQNPQAFAISPDAKIFVVDNLIYKKGTLKNVKELNIPIVAKGITSLLITNDSKYIIAGCYSGLIIVFDINGRKIKAMQSTAYSAIISCMAITDDSKHLLWGGSNNSLCLWELDLKNDEKLSAKEKRQNQDQLSFIYPTYLGESGTLGSINQIIIAPDNQTFLSIGDDKKGNIWDFNGNNTGELNGHKDGIVSGSYAADGKHFLTCSSAGAIYLWGKQGIGDSAPAAFSPLDYRNAALDDITVRDVYERNPTANKLISNIVNYTASIPQYKADSLSLTELSGLYIKELERSMFDQLSPYNKKLLLTCYAAFKEDSLNAKGKVYNVIVTTNRDYDKMQWQTKALMVDTADIQNAILYTYRYTGKADLYGEILAERNYKKAFVSLQNAVNISGAFLVKYPGNNLLKNLRIKAYANLSWYALFVKKYDVAIEAANKSLAFNKKFDWVITNIAAGNLLKGNFAEAKSIYTKYKNADRKNGSGPFKTAFLTDFDDLTAAKVIDVNDKKLADQIKEIKKLLNSK